MSKIKTYIIIGCLAVVFILLGSVCFLQSQLKKYKQQYNTEYSNRKALESERDSLSENTELLKYSVQDIKSSNDSLTKALYAANKKLKLKDKSLKQMQYMLSTATRTDSLIYRDTLFMNKSIHIDTTLGNEWVQTRLILEYPSTIKVSPTVVSEKMVFMNEVKKIDGKPSKIFFVRWFQKKYRTVEVDVIENNPYIINDRSKFIEIIK